MDCAGYGLYSYEVMHKFSVCHNHLYKKCGYCRNGIHSERRLYNEIIDCDECGKNHCLKCKCHICGGCYNNYKGFNCTKCKRNICKQCQRYNKSKMCMHCHVPESCDSCKEFLYYRMSYKCQGCGSNICIDCKEFFGWHGGKTLRQCNVCDDKKRKEQRSVVKSNNSIIVPEMSESMQIDTNVNEDIMDFCSKYDKRRKYRIKRNKRKMTLNCFSHQRRLDRICNTKQNRRFNKRYGLCLQY